MFGTPLEVVAHQDYGNVASAKEPSIPFVMSRLCNFIEENDGFQFEGLFRTSGNAKLIEKLRATFDTEGDAPLESEGDIPSAAALLKLFLRELPDSLIPTNMHSAFVDAVKEYETIFEGKRKISVSLLSRFNTLPPLHVDIPANEMEDSFMSVSSSSYKSEASSLKLETDDSNLPILMIDDLSIINSQSSRKRKERKLLALQSPAQRSSSEERHMNESKKSLDVFEMRRCSSHEEILPSDLLKGESPIASMSPHPPHAKRRETENFGASSVCREEFESSRISPMNLHEDPIDSKVSLIDKGESCEDEYEYVSFGVKEATDSLKENNYKMMHRDIEAKSFHQNHLSDKRCSNSAFSVSNSENKHIESSAKDTVSNTSPNSVLREIPAFDLNSLHQNADGCEPIVSEHRYSWPSLNGNRNGSDEVSLSHASNSGNSLSHSLLQHSSLQFLKKANSYEAPVSPSAYRGFLSQRVAHLDETIPPSPPVEQEEIFSVKKSLNPIESVAMKDIKKRISSLKKRLKAFENEYEQENGYRPSHEQKMSSSIARPLLLELNRHRKELKELREDSRLELSVPTNRNNVWYYSDINSNVHVSKRNESNDFEVEIFSKISVDERAEHLMENVLQEIQRSLQEKRELAGRPEFVEDMTPEQVLVEKLELQKALLKYESLFGRPESKEDRDVMRPIYDRYRVLKRAASRLSSKAVKKDSTELQPILEHVAMNFSSPTGSRKNSLESEKRQQQQQKTEEESATKKSSIHSNLHELPYSELLNEMRKAAEEKKHLRKVIKTFEEDFQKKMGRKVEKEDRVHLETVYSNYKHVKGKLRLMEALVAKSEKARAIK
ncbi:hypothetical protein B4U79_01083 [Dinothrombium tinctorium]|uniref:Rho-GAP domain-containing protein n=1 Tax=Dinothrombium tinctorium TaxID=1965070 RepID=A0A3S3QRE3_9ACAR|nr:hypothetical protein B4U79_01083 [Dinothrombium tinctorium]